MNLKGTSERKIFFTADLHLFHKNIIFYDKRPVKDIEEMYSWIIDIWNRTVRSNDLVFILGDITLTSSDKVIPILQELKGEKYLLPGNHDLENMLQEYWRNHVFEDILPVLDVINYTPQGSNTELTFQISHYPLLDWYCKQKGSYNLFAHTHGSLMDHDPSQIEIGWPIWQRPLEITEIIEMLKRQIQEGKPHFFF